MSRYEDYVEEAYVDFLKANKKTEEVGPRTTQLVLFYDIMAECVFDINMCTHHITPTQY